MKDQKCMWCKNVSIGVKSESEIKCVCREWDRTTHHLTAGFWVGQRIDWPLSNTVRDKISIWVCNKPVQPRKGLLNKLLNPTKISFCQTKCITKTEIYLSNAKISLSSKVKLSNCSRTWEWKCDSILIFGRTISLKKLDIWAFNIWAFNPFYKSHHINYTFKKCFI